MKLSKVIKDRFIGDYGKSIDEYKIDGKDVSVSEGAKAFKDSFDELEKSLIYSGREGEDKDCSIWLKFKSDDAISMSYEEAIKKLTK